MKHWWTGTRLVAGRGLRETLRSTSFRVVTALLLVMAVAAVVVPRLIDTGRPAYTLATVEPAPRALVTVVDAAAQAGDFDVTFTTEPDAEAAQAAVRDGTATAALADGTLYVSSEDTGPFPTLVSQAVVAVETAHRLDELGLTPEQIQHVTNVPAPQQVQLGPATDAGRAGIGFAVGVVLYIALLFAGNAIGATVATEKSSRISEVLLAVVRPSQLLVGTVLAVGTTTLLQLVTLAAPPALVQQLTGGPGLPAAAGGDIALAVVWFLLGFVLYAFLFAATAAMVDKVSEVAAAMMPVTAVLIVAYLLGLLVVLPDPNSPAAVALSLFPLSSPLTMPIRWASGLVPGWQLAVAMGLVAVTAVLVALLAAGIYGRALVITGRRVRVRDLLHPGR